MALKTVNRDDARLQPSSATPDLQEPAPGETSATPAVAKPGVRRYALPIIAALVGLLVMWFGGQWLITGRFEIATDNAHVRADITNVAAKVQGYVQSVNVDDNQAVTAGDVLLTLEAGDYQARLAQAKADLTQAQADAAQANRVLALRTLRSPQPAAARRRSMINSLKRRLPLQRPRRQPHGRLPTSNASLNSPRRAGTRGRVLKRPKRRRRPRRRKPPPPALL